MIAKDIELPEIPCDTKPKAGVGFSFLKEFLKEHDYEDMYRKFQEQRVEDWTKRVQSFEEDPSFLNSWRYVDGHPLFWRFVGPSKQKDNWFHEEFLIHDQGVSEGLEIEVVLVDPEDDCISDDEEKNTAVRVWYEVMACLMGPRSEHRIHAYEADGGGKTYEEAIIMAAQEIHRVYGNDRRVLDEEFKEDLF